MKYERCKLNKNAKRERFCVKDFYLSCVTTATAALTIFSRAKLKVTYMLSICALLKLPRWKLRHASLC